MLFALLLGKPGVSMNFGNALVTGIRKAFGSLFQINPAVLKQPEIMPATFGKSGAEYLSAFIVRDNLRLLRMALLFAGIAQTLFFLGRSTGLSVTSTKTTSKSFSSF